jgi:DHA1 family bicyclomycin/chloramphenicol resistance-like MFS transporter
MLNFLLFTMNFLATLSLDMYLPAVPAIKTALQTTISFMDWFFSIGFWGVFIGRLSSSYLLHKLNHKYIISMVVGCVLVGSLGLVFATSIYALLWWRFLLCLGVGSVTVVSFTIVSGLSDLEKKKIISSIDLSFPLAFIVAPLLGSYITINYSWRAIFAIMLIQIPFIFLVKSYLGKKINPVKQFIENKINFKTMFMNSEFMALVLFQSTVSAVLVAYLSQIPMLYMGICHVDEKQYGILQALPMAAFLFGVISYKFFMAKSLHQLMDFAAILLLLTVICFLLIISFAHLNPINLSILFCIYCFSMAFLSSTATMYCMSMYKSHASIVSGIILSSRTIVMIVFIQATGFISRGNLVNFGIDIMVQIVFLLIIYSYMKARITYATR